jgi:DnaJ-class molecular chaperone
MKYYTFKTASQKDIKSSCKILHPDKHDNNPEVNEIFELLHEAFEVVLNAKKQKPYNSKSHKQDGVNNRWRQVTPNGFIFKYPSIGVCLY